MQHAGTWRVPLPHRSLCPDPQPGESTPAPPVPRALLSSPGGGRARPALPPCEPHSFVCQTGTTSSAFQGIERRQSDVGGRAHHPGRSLGHPSPRWTSATVAAAGTTGLGRRKSSRVSRVRPQTRPLLAGSCAGPTEEAVLSAAATRRRRAGARLLAHPPGGRTRSGAAGAGRAASFHDARGGLEEGRCGPASRPSGPAGPLGKNFRPGIDYNPPLSWPRDPRARGAEARGMGNNETRLCAQPGTRLEEVMGRGRVPEPLSPASLDPGLRLCAADRKHQRPRRPFRAPGNQASSGGTQANPGRRFLPRTEGAPAAPRWPQCVRPNPASPASPCGSKSQVRARFLPPEN